MRETGPPAADSRTPARPSRWAWLAAILLVGGAVLIGISRRDELMDALRQLTRVHWP